MISRYLLRNTTYICSLSQDSWSQRSIEHSIRHILSFTHALRLYYIRWMLLNSKLIWWYFQRAVCARIWYRAIFCAILHISACSPSIAEVKDPSFTSPTTTTITTYTIISASLWTSLGTLPWWRCLPFAEECWPWRVWYHCLRHNGSWRSVILHQFVLYEESYLQYWM